MQPWRPLHRTQEDRGKDRGGCVNPRRQGDDCAPPTKKLFLLHRRGSPPDTTIGATTKHRSPPPATAPCHAQGRSFNGLPHFPSPPREPDRLAQRPPRYATRSSLEARRHVFWIFFRNLTKQCNKYPCAAYWSTSSNERSPTSSSSPNPQTQAPTHHSGDLPGGGGRIQCLLPDPRRPSRGR